MTQQNDLFLLPKAISPIDEQKARIQLAATYRLIDRYEMSDLVCTHISARIPGSQEQFLLNPYGVMFDEITASSLIKVDLDGNLIDSSDRAINPAGFVIHSAIYKARPDINCIIHTHSPYGMAVSALESGLLPLTQIALLFYNRVAYHNYEGVSLDLDERDRLVKSLGDKKVMILLNHGLLAAGETIPEAFIKTYYLEKACEVQILAQSSGGKLITPSETICEQSAQQQEIVGLGQLQFPALLRMLDRTDPSYRD
jgi:ribulose-5-phosphate 4-epimerase/fuculose-1-phosphate aldolase